MAAASVYRAERAGRERGYGLAELVQGVSCAGGAGTGPTWAG
jgi:hypothetical protein